MRKHFNGGKKGRNCFSVAGKTGQCLLFFKSSSIFWDKCFCFKMQMISCEPSKRYLFSLLLVFYKTYWNKNSVPFKHLLWYYEFIFTRSLILSSSQWKQTALVNLYLTTVKHFQAVLKGHTEESLMKTRPWELHSCNDALWDSLWRGSLKSEIGKWSYSALKQWKSFDCLGLQYLVLYQTHFSLGNFILSSQRFSCPFGWTSVLVEEFSD